MTILHEASVAVPVPVPVQPTLLSLADVDALVDGLLAQVEGLSGSEASARLADVSRSAAKLSAAYRVALVSKINSSQVWREKDPNATAASFLREELVLDHHEAKADLRAATSFERFPELAQACRDGRVSRDKMDLILRIGLRNPTRSGRCPGSRASHRPCGGRAVVTRGGRWSCGQTRLIR